jgi:hypothetical protein
MTGLSGIGTAGPALAAPLGAGAAALPAGAAEPAAVAVPVAAGAAVAAPAEPAGVAGAFADGVAVAVAVGVAAAGCCPSAVTLPKKRTDTRTEKKAKLNA